MRHEALSGAVIMLVSMLAGITNICTAGEFSINLEQLPQSWREADGQQRTLAEMRGHRLVLTMAYADCHRICPMTIGELQGMQRRADSRGETVEFVIVGYDPVVDGPAAWRAYRDNHGLDRANWHFLTGTTASVELLAAELGFAFWRYDEHVMHESHAILFDTQGVEQAVLGAATPRWSGIL